MLIFLFSKDALNWLGLAIETFIFLQKISILNKCCPFEFSTFHKALFLSLHKKY